MSFVTPRRAAIAVVGIALVTLPIWVGNPYYINVASQILLFAVFALALNVLVGYGGLVSLGHAGLFAMAGYGGALVLQAGHGHFLADLAAVAVTVVASAVFGVLALRSSGIGFLMITLALGQIVWGIAYRANTLTEGDNGLRYPARPQPFGIDINSAPSFYWFTLIVFAIALFFIWRVTRSPFGAALQGARDQPRRMRMLGHNVWLVRLITFVMAGFWGSVASVLYVYYNLFLSPHAISLQQSAEILLMAILGGASSLTGPIVGAAIITLVKNVISTYVERWNTLLGVIFVVVIVFMPYGLVPGCKQLWERLRGHKSRKEGRKAARDAAHSASEDARKRAHEPAQ